ncbi:MAG: ATP synthase subunit I [Acidobacteriota bacterium]|nr:ATP synthase subunit I [Acidobacteriota bacterium]
MEAESRAIERLGWWMLSVALLGTGAAGMWGGWRWALGFLIGAVASYWNFRALKGVVDRLAAASAGVPSRRSGVLRVLLRFLLLGVGAFAILRYSEVSVTAALIGLFSSAAAVLVEIVFELAFANEI